jgi:hypothetical protein
MSADTNNEEASVLRSFGRIVDLHTVAITATALIATSLCVRLGYAIELPEGLIAIAVVFSARFAINAAFARREMALASYASIKSSATALYFAHRDWHPSLSNSSSADLRRVTVEVMEGINHFSRQPTSRRRRCSAFTRLLAPHFAHWPICMLRSSGISLPECTASSW